MKELEVKLKELCNCGKCGLCCFYPMIRERTFEGKSILKYYPKTFSKFNKSIEKWIEGTNFDIILQFKEQNNEYIFYACKYLDVVIDEEKNQIKTMLCSIYPKEGEEDKRSLICDAKNYSVLVGRSQACYFNLDELKVWVNDKKYSINKELELIEHQRRKVFQLIS